MNFVRTGDQLSIQISKKTTFFSSKTGGFPKDEFRFNIGGEELENVNHYKYFGVNFSNTAKFSVAEKH